jgi:urea transport system permease protein
VEAIRSLAGNVSLTARATLNPLLVTTDRVRRGAARGRQYRAGTGPRVEALSVADAYAMLVDEGLAPALIPRSEQVGILAENIVDGRGGRCACGQPEHRSRARPGLCGACRGGNRPARPVRGRRGRKPRQYVFFEVYREDSVAVTTAARETLDGIETRVGFYRFLDLSLDGISLASIYFLAAIGLAITFGVMGVINMAHGEFIMMGAYTGYVVQTLRPERQLSLAIAMPLAFVVTFMAGVAMERLVIRWLYHRPLETLLATFGISIALQQICAKNIFGTLARR